MKRVVWKYTLGETDTRVVMPLGGQILHVAQQGPYFCLWALVDPLGPIGMRLFRLTGTGHVLDDWSPDWKFVGTFLVDDGSLVFHVWDCGETP